MKKRMRIGEIAKETGLTVRTVRFYGDEGLLPVKRSPKGQRWYTEEDVIYLRRIMELKGLGFSLDEIGRIVRMKEDDEKGDKRRMELLSAYRAKYSEAEERKKRIEEHMGELRWHIRQLEGAENTFRECPGALCESCRYKKRCSFFREQGD